MNAPVDYEQALALLAEEIADLPGRIMIADLHALHPADRHEAIAAELWALVDRARRMQGTATYCRGEWRALADKLTLALNEHQATHMRRAREAREPDREAA